jgi:uncharacterized membrane protein
VGARDVADGGGVVDVDARAEEEVDDAFFEDAGGGVVIVVGGLGGLFGWCFLGGFGVLAAVLLLRLGLRLLLALGSVAVANGLDHGR